MFEGFIVCDVETTGTDFVKNDVIEISMIKLSNGDQRTWCLAPTNKDTISTDALRVNGHKIEDLLHKTKYGIDTYKDPAKVIVEIENWLMEENISTENTWLIGYNVSFDRNMLEQLWSKCNAMDSFPFGRRIIDSMQFEVLMDLASDTKRDSYSLNATIKKYGIKNEKAHSAAADTKATQELFVKQLDAIKKLLKNA